MPNPVVRKTRPGRIWPMTVARAFALAFTLFLSSVYLAQADASASEEILRVGSSTIRIEIPEKLTVPRPLVIDWVNRAAVAVSNYLGRFPTKELTLKIEVGGHGVSDGVTYGAREIHVRVGRRTKEADFKQDWVLTHEMFHLAFPTLKDRYLWMMEGLSDYLEPIARARVGQLTHEDTWREFVEGLPQGLPVKGGHGLDGDFTRERIYWGGNLFWLLADVRIREKTDNRHSVDDAIRAILEDGGNGDAAWSLEQVLKAGDKATHTTVLRDLYEELGPKPGEVNLDTLWNRLGVKYSQGAITFDNTAPDAAIRMAITGGQ
jgi:hypothetical protein